MGIAGMMKIGREVTGKMTPDGGREEITGGRRERENVLLEWRYRRGGPCGTTMNDRISIIHSLKDHGRTLWRNLPKQLTLSESDCWKKESGSVNGGQRSLRLAVSQVWSHGRLDALRRDTVPRASRIWATAFARLLSRIV
jgi:hypothetical protein